MRGKHTGQHRHRGISGITPAHAGKTMAAAEMCGVRRDHPRACGENRIEEINGMARVGSPPRMRGKHSLSCTKSPKRGITPAHAGKTKVRIPVIQIDWDHPRACGENFPLCRFRQMKAGSPPRMRGKPWAVFLTGGVDGITPAHAGKTFFVLRIACVGGDHPRACGENTSERAYFRG